MRKKKKLATKRKPGSLPIHAIVWIDAVKHDTDIDRAEPEVGVTVGIIVDINDDRVQIAGEAFADGDFRDITAIPKGMIQRITKLKDLALPEFKFET